MISLFDEYMEFMNIATEARRVFKGRLYELVGVDAAMANPHRLLVLDVLTQGGRTIESIAAETRLLPADTSRHLTQLRQAHLILGRREERFVHYRLARPEVVSLMLALCHIAERHLTEIDRVVGDLTAEPAGTRAVTG